MIATRKLDTVVKGASEFAVLSMLAICVVILIVAADPYLSPAYNAEIDTEKICSQTTTCTGLGIGECTAAGFFCFDKSSNPCSTQSTNCSWTSTYSCNTNPNWDCRHGDLSYISTDCGGDCKLIIWNDCACVCKDLGIDTVESGTRDSCESIPRPE